MYLFYRIRIIVLKNGKTYSGKRSRTPFWLHSKLQSATLPKSFLENCHYAGDLFLRKINTVKAQYSRHCWDLLKGFTLKKVGIFNTDLEPMKFLLFMSVEDKNTNRHFKINFFQLLKGKQIKRHSLFF